MNENYNDPNQQQGGPLAMIGDVAEQAIANAIGPLISLVKSLEAKITSSVGRIDRFDERLSALEGIVQNLDGEFAGIQGRVRQASAAALKNQRMFPGPVCGAPTEFHPMPGEDEQAAKDRVCCHRCGIHTGNKVLVERAKADQGK